MSGWQKAEEILDILKTFGIFESVVRDRERHLVNMTNGQESYELGALFGCKICVTVTYKGRDEKMKPFPKTCSCGKIIQKSEAIFLGFTNETIFWYECPHCRSSFVMEE